MYLRSRHFDPIHDFFHKIFENFSVLQRLKAARIYKYKMNSKIRMIRSVVFSSQFITESLLSRPISLLSIVLFVRDDTYWNRNEITRYIFANSYPCIRSDNFEWWWNVTPWVRATKIRVTVILLKLYTIFNEKEQRYDNGQLV